jgi:hypothetical protein
MIDSLAATASLIDAITEGKALVPGPIVPPQAAQQLLFELKKPELHIHSETIL